MQDIVLVEIINGKLGIYMQITASQAEGSTSNSFQFNNLGDDAKILQHVIQDMIEGLSTRSKQKKETDMKQLEEIEIEMERRAIQNSMIEQIGKS